MNSIVKRMEEDHIKDFIEIGSNAYPAMNINTPDEKENIIKKFKKLQNENPSANIYGLYRNDIMLGGMILFDFLMNFSGNDIKAGGVGFVAVDLLHKKEKIAKELITRFLEHYKNKETYMAMLYPFRPDFYKKMGFGYGTKMNQYKVKPSSLPKGDTKKNICFLNSEDKENICECYNRYTSKIHGMIKRSQKYIEGFFKNPNNKIIGYKNNDKIEGYILFSFKKDTHNRFLINDINIHEFIYESREVFLELMTFLNSQNDQIRYVIFNTQDEYFHHALIDPRNDTDNLIPSVYHESNTQGVGLMYRVIDINGMFKTLKNHNFSSVNCKLKLTIKDTFIKENDGSFIIHFNNGLPELKENDYEVEINMDISDFSSLLVGSIDFKSLYRLGLAEISETNYINTINKLFCTETKPICMTAF